MTELRKWSATKIIKWMLINPDKPLLADVRLDPQQLGPFEQQQRPPVAPPTANPYAIDQFGRDETGSFDSDDPIPPFSLDDDEGRTFNQRLTESED